MPNHMLFMSFDGSSLSNLIKSMNRFFEYTVAMASNPLKIRLCYIGTASNDDWLERVGFSLFLRLKFGQRIHFSTLIIKKTTSEQAVREFLINQDIIFIGGGNTAKMLRIWKNKGFINVLNQLKQEKRLPILAGVSAGGMYPFHSGLTDSTPGEYKPLKCLEWIKDSFCPHADSSLLGMCTFDNKKLYQKRLGAYQSAVQSGKIPAGFAVPNNCMLHFHDDKLVQALSSLDNHHCVYVSTQTSEPIETIYLTSKNTYSNAQTTLRILGYDSLPNFLPPNTARPSYLTKLKDIFLWVGGFKLHSS